MLTLSSPAKINLFLRILRKRPDGYHELASLFQTISLCDQLTFEQSKHDTFTCSDPALPLDHNNLVIKALNLFRKKTGIVQPITIHLEKHIPHQAGLGGGSSNAATTLWALNELSGRSVSIQALVSMGAELGSDVAFFLSRGTAYCTGRGECIEEVPALPQKALTIVKPKVGLSTPLVYGNLRTDSLLQRDPVKVLEGFMKGSPIYFNDLEVPAFIVMPELKALKENLQLAGYTDVLMSGSGSSFFCIGERENELSSELQQYSVNFINREVGDWF